MARPNRLAAETSPYLLQHARNPVDWYPWGPEALGRAQGEDKPILLSIGYAACHWCHVMERESFEDERIAALMNEHFVCVKVDREERPDLDEIYMSATVALTGSGGWPMTVFLLPSGEPFFAGTYFPPEDRGGRPGFPTLLSRVAELWKQGRSELLDQARELTIEVRRRAELAAPSGISADAIRLAARQLGREYDASFGGFGSAPKFPPSAALSLLLRHHRRSAAPEALEMVERTLDAMASGGIYDQLGGGFCRYSTDERWLVPHFEKMLYDNAQLATVYLEAYQATGRANYRRVARETLDYLLREMQAPSGGFFSSSDADSEGEEGKFFVFTRAQVKKALGEPDATRFSAFYGVSEEGNFEGKNVLTTWRSLDAVSRELGVSPLELTESLERGKEALFELRSTRVPPAVDDKVLVSWNGLTVSALARGARTLSDPRYLEAARRAAEFVLNEMRRPDGGLYRTARAGRAHLNAYLEDYAFFAEGLLELYEAGGGDRYLQVSRELTARMLQDFGDEAGGALFHTARDHEELYARPREGHDGALPSPNAVAARLLARLAAHTGDEALRASALEIARAFGAQLKNAPRAFATLLTAVDLLLEPPLEIVIVGDEHDEERAELVRAASAHFLPNAVLALVPAEGSSLTPLTEGKGLVDGAPAAYVCEGFACQKPLADPDELSALLLSFEAKNKSKTAFELGRGRLAGRATPEGTSRRAARSGLPDLAFTTYRGLRLSRISFGTYRSGLDHPEHRRTLTNGLERGINVIDTSSSFVWGDSERLVGEVLGELIARGELARDELFIVTKCGLALRASAERLAERAKNEATRPRLTVPLRPDAPWEEGVFSLDPEFLKEQISASLQRLGLETVDTLLVQSPEHLLLAGASRDELREALLETFRLLEGEVSAGRIGSYGVLTNTAASGDESRVDLLELLDATRRELGPDAHFRVVEMPGNLVERAVFDQDADGSSLVSRLEAQGLFTIVCRPLSALSGGALFRLVDPARTKDGAQAKNLSPARYKVASLEAEFETTLAPALRLAGLLGPEALLPLSRGLGAALERSESLEQFTQAEATLVTPRLRAVLAELDRAHQGPGGERWQAFRKSYVSAVGAYLACLHESAADKNQARLEALDRDIAERFPWKELEGSRRNWATRALDSVLGTPGVSTVALGIRSLSHLDPALDCLGRLRERGS